MNVYHTGGGRTRGQQAHAHLAFKVTWRLCKPACVKKNTLQLREVYMSRQITLHAAAIQRRLWCALSHPARSLELCSISHKRHQLKISTKCTRTSRCDPSSASQSPPPSPSSCSGTSSTFTISSSGRNSQTGVRAEILLLLVSVPAVAETPTSRVSSIKVLPSVDGHYLPRRVPAICKRRARRQAPNKQGSDAPIVIYHCDAPSRCAGRHRRTDVPNGSRGVFFLREFSSIFDPCSSHMFLTMYKMLES